MQQGKLDKLAEAFHVLGHPTKLAILNYVLLYDVAGAEAVVPTLVATELNIPVARAAYSLKRMHQAGVLKRQCSGRYTFYTIDDKFLDQVRELFA
jgi:predicted transcriptional regulator